MIQTLPDAVSAGPAETRTGGADASALDRPFRLIAFDWDGTAVVGRRDDATPLRLVLEDLLKAGVPIAVITGTHFGNIDKQLSVHINGPHKRNLYILTNRGSEVFGFDEASYPVVLWRRKADPAEDRLLTETADDIRSELAARTGLDIAVIANRLNRRKIDLIPVPEWSDPPKSDMDRLNEAVNARLRGAGMTGGLREAAEIAERAARRRCFADARITSDIKHIEIGLTDKSDAMNWVMRELAAKAGIAAEDVLVGGDEFGFPVTGVGSDSLMMTPSARGAVFVSVGPEPAGVPPGVIHVGGGPARFREIIEDQAARHRDRLPLVELKVPAVRPPIVPTDEPAWRLVERGYHAAREREIESLFAVSNGRLGVRGSLPEGGAESSPATVAAGAFQVPPGGAVAEYIPLPDWTGLHVEVDGGELRLEAGESPEHRRTLDMGRGIWRREWVHRDSAGRSTRLDFVRFASLADPHLLVQTVTLTAENYSGRVRITAPLRRPSAPGPSWNQVPPAALDDDGNGSAAALQNAAASGEVETAELLAADTRTVVAMARACRLRDDRNGRIACRRDDIGPLRWEFDVEVGRTYRLDQVAAVRTSRHIEAPLEAAVSEVIRVRDEWDVERLSSRHAAAWAQRWQTADVRVDGDELAQRALRVAAYHLIAAGDPRDGQVSVGARAMTGPAYNGHVFWDTEIFLLPFYSFTHPATARAALMYRHHTLPAAREKARRFGYRGAMYAWESAGTGREETPSRVVAPDGTVVRVLCGELEQHISADVAYAVRQYWDATRDDDFLWEAGVEILVETARFWASRATAGTDGKYHIRGVIGPDEYHEDVDDNAFTNAMAKWNLEQAASAVSILSELRPDELRELSGRLALSPDEPPQWMDIAGRMYDGFDPAANLFEQFAGFHRLEHVDLAPYLPAAVPLDVLLGRQRVTNSQIVKQADVVMMLHLLGDRIPADVQRANYRHYEPRTGHGSSLSPGIHSVVAARLGMTDLAAKYFRQAAEIDLADNMGNASGGVHIAAMGSLWQAAVFGFAGMSLRRDGLAFDPHLPPGWKRLAFSVCWRGRRADVVADGAENSLEVTVSGPAGMTVAARGAAAVRIEPGRCQRIRRSASGWGTWENAG